MLSNQYITTTLKTIPGVDMRRLDLLPDAVNGNKGFKLKHNLAQILKMANPHMLTYGGYYSNHLHASAAACKLHGIRLTAVIRGEQPGIFGATLRYMADSGTHLHFVSRSAYAQRHEPSFQEELRSLFGEYYQVPEGGANLEGVLGCAEILQAGDEIYSTIACACGTGTMAAGIGLSLKTHQRLVVFSSLAGGKFLKENIGRLISETGIDELAVSQILNRIDVVTDFHFGGYARWNDELLLFIRTFLQNEGIPLEQVYTGKLMYGLCSLLKVQHPIIQSRDRILAIHSGGLQGVLPGLISS